MKNMLKNKTSLIIVCVFIGILICYFTMCNCRMNYNLIEGMTTPTTTMPTPGSGSGSTAPTTTSPLKAPMAKAASMGVPAAAAPAAAPSGSNTTAAVGSKSKVTAPATSAPAPVKAGFQAGREGFQLKQPIEFASLKESKSDDWNLSKWVKDAMRYAKGMGN
jgi:hypothetical protein